MKSTTNPRLLTAGTLVNGRYLVERLIGQGGMGAVYEARDQRLKGVVALKQTTVQTESSTKAFEREAQLLAHLRHPVLPKVIDYFVDDAGQFLVMEFFPGNDLAHLLDQRGGPFPVNQVMTWADQLLRALIYLHQQQPPVIHRDIKPQNLKLTTDREIVLLDFGLAKGSTAAQAQVTSSGSIFGYTPLYAPLEQIKGMGTDPRSDLYSLAATLYHLCTGVPPVDTLTRAAAIVSRQPDPQRPAQEVNPEVPIAISNVLTWGLALPPEERPDSARTMQAALASAWRTTGGIPSQAQTWDQETQLDIPPAASTPQTTKPPATLPTMQLPLPSAPPAEQPRPGAEVLVADALPPSQPLAPPDVRASDTHRTAMHPQGRMHRPGTTSPQKYRSPFWAIVLIGMGVIWLLDTIGVVSVNMAAIFRLWPAFLIMLGLDLLIGRRSPRLSALLGILAVLLALALSFLLPPSALLDPSGVFRTNGEQHPGVVQTSPVVAPLDGAKSAEVEIVLPPVLAVIGELTADSPNLIEGQVQHQGDLTFEVSGDEDKTVVLRDDESDLAALLAPDPDPMWTLGLSPAIPLTLDIQGSTGETTLDLSKLQLVDLYIDAGDSTIRLDMPAPGHSYDTLIDSDSASFQISIADSATLNLEMNGSITALAMTIGENAAVTASIDSDEGDFVLNVPTDAALQIKAQGDIERVNVRHGFQETTSEDGTRIWETPGFEAASQQSIIELEDDVDSLHVK